MPKTFILDTNVLLHNGSSLLAFKDNDVVLPMAVIEELDHFKKNHDELGRNARWVIRKLDEIRKRGSLMNGVPIFPDLPDSGKLQIISARATLTDEQMTRISDSALDLNLPDNRILRVALALQQNRKKVYFISKDINLRLKADALGLQVMDFENERIEYEKLYSGFRIHDASIEEINDFYKNKEIDLKLDLFSNEFVVLQNPENSKRSAIGRKIGDGKVQLIGNRSDGTVWNIQARNKEQRMALELLLDPDVKLITLVGCAGTGKTLLALAAALEQVQRLNLYEKILVSRPIMPLGNDIGFLPGAKDDKLFQWMKPIFDNLDFLLQSNRPNSSSKKVSDLIASQRLELEAITYIRGRSLANQFVIVDEAQNLTPHEVKTIISRAGEGTKMVLTGDPQQIDNPYLDASSNGLTYSAERLKGLPIHGHITLAHSERSELAGIAAKYL
ncbi:MAG: PhoH family protein [Victivallaceae bacterium]|jgi:PhoH-like ATPase|nr:PhoH family protein [Victivallaceae bacterium]NLK83683.1 PhoH family protein [Lentisphaerota bacterium]MDD3117481.1 PhoH family protein [Victivallaceae bacterium]MDD3704170.1 PhoH family protein [Victivallaceae bacterium]MDD4317361.1 PhoH family protein [Victivallaceae bacterium]